MMKNRYSITLRNDGFVCGIHKLKIVAYSTANKE